MSRRVSENVHKRVQQRAENRCEYCLKPSRIALSPFQVDHIIPILHGGDSSEDNLAWSCFECNVLKGTNIASLDPTTKQLTPLFHPRKDDWNAHFELDGIMIKGKTPQGRATVRLLEMNHPSQLEYRQWLFDIGVWPKSHDE